MRRLLTLTLVFGLVLAACGSSDEEAATTTLEGTSTTGDEQPTTTAAPEEDTTTTAAVETTSTAGESAGAGGDECLIGTWVLDTDAFIENFAAVFAEAGMPEADVSALDGTFTVEMNADGTYDAVREAWGFAVTMSEGTVTLEINGTESGTWATNGDTLTIDGDVSDLTVDASIEADGQEIPLPESQVPIETPPGIATDSTFECSGDILTLTNEGVESTLTRA